MRKDDPSKRCGNCDHWHRTDAKQGQGVCCFDPPGIVTAQAMVPPSLLRPGAAPELQTQVSSMYPPVGAAGIPCSHWKPEQ